MMEAAYMVNEVNGKYQDDKDLDNDGNWCRKTRNALDAPTQQTDNDEKDDKCDEERYIHDI